MSSLVLDTHAWVWWISQPDRLSRRQRTAIERVLKRSNASLLVSIISCWEVALLCQHNRVRFTIPADRWLEDAAQAPGIQLVPLSLPIVTTAARLTSLRDPADMLIVATAQHCAAQLLSSDERIAQANLVPVVE